MAQVIRRGHVMLDLDASRVQAAWFPTGEVTDEADDTHEVAASFTTGAGETHLVEPSQPAPDAAIRRSSRCPESPQQQSPRIG